jgi:fructosamine-3-kinase
MTVAEAMADVLDVAIGRIGVEKMRASQFVETAVVWLDDERVAFVKYGDAPAGFFAGEAAGLRAIARALDGAARVSAAEVIASSERMLALRYVEPVRAREAGDDDVAFGRALAQMHRAEDPHGYGFPCATFCGATPLVNSWNGLWVSFFQLHRWAPMIEALRARGVERAALQPFIDALPRIARMIADAPPDAGALVHGDLWSGNVLASKRGPVLVDPAAVYAHREMELGMATLFGGLSERAFESYCDAWPLQAGWERRIAIYRAWHLLNHALLFGGDSLAQAWRTLADAIR